ncbi:TRAP transporter large permease [Oceanobacillus alkalisoli]|uniref:TRAP transporter large permease n=1 Tax=Oceanobacillus alkalisoli TaxID=2925113 RepID=UPI001EE48C68|nr:TRAP transporter large permease [Oceanobacillus alkalisoli]MCG5102561.1 TRAP transporter large permease [Oceanobacillus alkalisoli]
MLGILFGLFIVLLILGVPIGFVIALSSFGGIAYLGLPIELLAQRFFTALDSFSLMAIPLFILAGVVMTHGGITRRIIDFALSIVGSVRGALSQVVSVSGVLLAGVSGSGVADTAALGSIMVPEMKKRNYDPGFSAALVASAGSIGLIIPPSIALIVYGASAQASIGDLFMAGIIPGLLIAVGFMVYCYIVARIKNYPREGKFSFYNVWKNFKSAFWALLMPIIILVGIRGGIFTATEGGAVISVYALFVGMFVYKEIKIKQLPKIFYEATMGTAVITSIIAATSLFGWLLTNQQIPQKFANTLLSISDNPIIITLILIVILILVGLFIDSSPAILLLTPILAPVATSIGMDLVQFGIVMVITLTIGLLTPPVGTALFVVSNISKVPILELSRKLIPFWIIMIVVTLLVAFIPGLTNLLY